MNWSPDKDLLEHTLSLGEGLATELAEAGPARLADEDTQESLLLFFEVVGTLHFLGEAARAKTWRPRLAAFGADALQETLSRWVPAELADANAELVMLRRPLERAAAPAAARDPEELDADADEALFARVVEAFRPRDRVELVLAGASSWMNRAAELSPEARELVDVFDEAAREEIFLLVSMNQRRRDRLMWIKPGLQSPFWWWARGCAFPEDALGSLFTAVEVLREFPEAGAFFDQLRTASAGLDTWLTHQAHTSGRGHVVPLRERLRPPPVPPAPEHTPRSDSDLSPMRLAAENSSIYSLWETLHKDEDVHVQVMDHFLRVLLREPILDGDPKPFAHLPLAYLEVPGEALRVRPYQEDVGRSAVFDLDAPAFDATVGVLHVQCAHGQVQLRLHELKWEERS